MRADLRRVYDKVQDIHLSVERLHHHHHPASAGTVARSVAPESLLGGNQLILSLQKLIDENTQVCGS